MHIQNTKHDLLLHIININMILYKHTVKILWEGIHGWRATQPNAAKMGMCAIHRGGLVDRELQTIRP